MTQKKERASIYSLSGLMLILGLLVDKVTAAENDEGVAVGK